MPVRFAGPVGLRAGESGARIAPGPIDARKRKESRATVHRTLGTRNCEAMFWLTSPLMILQALSEQTVLGLGTQAASVVLPRLGHAAPLWT
jgi:hypothetical protein